MPAEYEEQAIPGASVANLKWWELFQHEELTALIETALINNRELAIAIARIDEARAALGFVRADQFPSLDGAAGAGRGKRVEIAERTEETRQDSLGIIQARFDRGVVPLIDVNQAEIELADATAELAALQRQNQQAENLLSVLLGQNPGPILRTSGKDDGLFPPDIPAGLPSELLERRPDVRQASQLLAAQTARIGVAEALRFPSLGLTGSLGLASTELDDFISGDNKVWGVSANLLGPIFDAGRGKAWVETERARTDCFHRQPLQGTGWRLGD